MVNFVEYVVAELKSKRLSKSAAFELIKQFSVRPAGPAAAGAALHPLLQVNVSDMDRLAFRSSLVGSEHFLADHRVAFAAGEESVLPAVAYLEMARAALQQAVPNAARGTLLELRHCVWAQPLVVRGATAVSIELAPNTDGGIDYDILSGDGDQQTEHCQGHAQFVAPIPAPTLDIAQLQAQMQRGSLATAEVYAAFAAMGLRYGPAHQAVQQVHKGQGQVLAQLELPPCVRAQAAPFVLHPSLLDGALQAAIGLMQGETQPRLPFAVDLVRVFAACPPSLWVWLRHAAGSSADDAVSKLDIDLCDANGVVCVQMHGFSARALGPAAGADDASGVLRVIPQWHSVAADSEATAWTQRHVIVCEQPGIDLAALQNALPGSACTQLAARSGADLAQRYSDHAVACLETLQALLAGKPAGPVLLQLAVAATQEQAVFAGLGALLKTAARENPHFHGQLVIGASDSDAAALAQQLQVAQRHAGEPHLRLDRGSVQALRWQEQAATDGAPLFKEHGVYLISGGLGGLGAIFAREILQQTRHARVILTGRTAPAGARRDRLDALNAAAAGRVQYRSIDLADAAAVQALVDGVVAEHGALHGILHCAGMTADGFIAGKTADTLRQVLAPKVQGSINLDQASRALALDFFALFSSVAASLGNVGQADYATANAFLDEFASYRNARVAAGERHGHSVAIAWPLWQDGGMQLEPALQAELERTSGMRPLATTNGLQAFHQCLVQAQARWLVLEGHLPALRRSLAAARPRPAAAAPAGGAVLDTQELLEKTQEWLRRQFSQLLKLASQRIDPRAPLERYGIDSILAMRLTNTLEQTFGSLSKTLLFEYRSIADLAAYFVESQAAALNGLFARHRAATPGNDAAALVALPAAVTPPRLRRGPLRQAIAAAAPAKAAEPIAIVGLSGRYPEARNLAAYWANLRDGKDCIVEIPASRWNWRDYYSDDRREGGRHYSRWGGFIEGVDEFDPLFFNMSPLEAERIDPQERLFLQHAWMAVEDAGYTRAELQGRAAREGLADIGAQVGVYVGVMYSEYQLFGAEASLRGQRTGLAGSFASIANRVSYAFDLHGPSMTLDTMCSSSLTAIHLACQDLRSGRTRLAIAGGVNVTIHPNKYLVLSAGQFISSDGHCQSFGEGGDGYIPGEGVGAVVLKRLSDAQRDGDHIYATIRGSALSHGGKTNGYTVPNPQAQTSAIALALSEARVDARHISYIEAHGTGTKLGDPIEIAALNKAFGQYTQERQYCLIGSAKSNIGHCEAAAGIAGLTKVLLQMQHRQIVPSLHSRTLNPHIDFAGSPFTVNQHLTDWAAPVIDGRSLPRIAGISSFGAGGSNAHVIVEEYVAAALASPPHAEVAILLSARTLQQLREQVQSLLEFVAAAPQTDLVAMAHTLQIGREAMDERLGLVVASTAELLEKLQLWLAGDADIDTVHQGQIQRHRDTLALFSSDADLQQTVERWLTGGKLGKVVELWSKGLDVRWAALYGAPAPARISLPTYPFARERYWIDAAAGGAAATAAAAGSMLHPLLHANVSDLSRQCYRSVFGGGEPWLADHRVLLGGVEQRVLPAVAYLEMARAAIEQAVPAAWRSGVLELRHCAWAQPLSVQDATSVSIVLNAADDGRIDYSIVSGDGGDNPLEHSAGQAIYVQETIPEIVDIAQLQQRMDRNGWPAAELYAALEGLGLRYGPAHKAVREVLRGDGEVLARLELPDCVRADADAYVLHPSLLDAALQSALALSGDTVSARLPFALDTLRIFGKASATMWAWLRYAAGSSNDDAVARLDIDLCDERGLIAVQLRGFSTRSLTAAPAQTTGQGLLAAVPQWRAIAAGTTATDWPQHLVVLCEMPHLATAELQALLPGSECSAVSAGAEGDLAQRYSAHAIAGFERIRDLLAARPSGPLLLQWVIADSAEHALSAGVAALLKSAALENPLFHGQVVVTGQGVTAAALAQQLQRAQAHPREALLRFAPDGSMQGLHWEELSIPAETSAAFKPDGVYLITGGMGGLGMLFARAIAAQAPAARIVLTGRGELDEVRRQRLAELNSAGGAGVHYRALDLLDAPQVVALVAEVVREFGALDGVLHSAGMLADGFLRHKSTADFRAVLAPKVAGTVNLDHATRNNDLQFFALFSSLAGAFGNVGQADYATANAFLDGFAQYRNQRVAAGERRGLSLSVNWPLWQDGGMQLPAPLQEQIAQATGMRTLSSVNGLRAFAHLLAQGMGRGLVMQGDLAAMRRTVFGQGETALATPAARLPAVSRASAPAIATSASPDLLQLTEEYLRQQFAASLKLPPQRIDVQLPLENYGIDSILAMRLTTLLEQTFGSLSKTLFFEYQSIAALAKYLAKAFPQVIARVTASAPALAGPAVAHAVAAPPTAPKFAPRRAFGTATESRGRAVAIVGLAGKYPLADDVDSFWDVLREGRDCISEIPAERWDHALYFDADRNKPGKSYSKWGGFISDIDKFDPLFFNIAPKEAELLDPQERLFLETAWQTVEDAGYSKQSLAGTRTGVYVGVMWGQYELYGVNSLAAGHVGVPSSSQASIANRVSYFFNLHGPSIAIDTMCSSSLTAIHLACEEIRRGTIDAAIAGGVNVSVHPHKYLTLSQGKFAASDGRCRSFGAGGDGYVPGEGVGAVLLKPLEHALRDGDHIYGVVRASSINHGGKTNGYTVPNPNAQAELIRDALNQAQIEPQSLGYIEAHGTGTALGDPIEITALAKAFGDAGEAQQYCAIGSVKSNIGHLESAAGIAAMTKVLLQLKHAQRVPSLHAEPANPNIDFSQSPFYVQTTLAPWPRRDGQPRRSGISSFGAGGANAHMVVEEYRDTRAASPAAATSHVFVLSARSARSLVRHARRMAEFLQRHAQLAPEQVAYTLQVGRSAMNARLAFVAADLAAFVAALQGWIAAQDGGERAVAAPDAGDTQGLLYGNSLDGNHDTALLVDGAAGRAFLHELLHSRDLPKLARLWTLGAEIDWSLLHATGTARRVSLPTYPFERQRYWIDTTPLAAVRAPLEAVTPAATLAQAALPVVAELPTCLHYGVSWHAAPLPAQGAAAHGTLLVLDSTDTVFRALAAQLGSAAPLVRVRFAAAYREQGPAEFDVRAGEEQDFRQLFAALNERGLLPDVILHRCSDGVTLDQSLPGTSSLHDPVFALLHVAKALMGLAAATRYVVIADAAAPQHQALAAFLKTLALEQPRFSGKVVSIDGDAGLTLAGEVAIAVAEIADVRAAVEEVRYRAVGSSIERCVRQIAQRAAPAAALDRVPLKQGGVYLITGGLGGLGLLFGEYLAQHYAARLVLVGRSASTAQHEQRLARLRQHASEIVYMQADVSRAEDAERVVREIKARYGRLSGVIHAAGVTRDGYVLKKTAADLRAVFDPKIGGAIQLDRATRNEQLDLFILFASIAGVNGNVGQSDYAYANQFLDAFAERRERQHAAGLRAGRTLSIDWPLWRDGGMQVSAEHLALLQARTGLAPLPTGQGLRLFEEMLSCDTAQGIALYGLASRLDAYIRGTGKPVANLAAAAAVPAAVATVAAETRSTAGTDLLARTLAYVKALIGDEIKLAPEHIDARERLESFGMDSVAISKVNAALERDLGELPKTLLYEHETVAEVSAFLVRQYAEPMRVLFAAQMPAGVAAVETIEAIGGAPPLQIQSAAVESMAIETAVVEPLAVEAASAQAPARPVGVVAAGEPASLSALLAAQSATQKIAIIGVHGHYPQSRDLDEFWQLLRDGRDATQTVPPERWDADACYDADPAAAGNGKIYCRSGGFLADVDKFDPALFRIQREEAKIMDPQERLFLQSVWTALEDAGYTRDDLRARHAKGKSADVGVFVGVTTNSYAQLAEDARRQGNMLTPSAMPWSIANRVSYFFDFKGPSLPVDTACSSSLVAVHMACESLRRGECQVAVAGGVNLYLHPSKYLSLCQRGMLASGGKTRSYGAGDDGFIPGEGVGCFILKPLEQAIADNDRIHGVILGSAFDHSGRSNGYSAPNPNSQAELIARTLAAAEVDPETIGCVEGHGTGTPLGDSLEVLALSQAFRRGTTRTGYCSLGSVKSNVGHAESAAGIASMTKALLQLKHGEFAPSLHSAEPNPDLDLATSPFYLQQSLAAWPRSGNTPRRALVNSFGAGGVNACLVLEEHVAGAVPAAAHAPQVLALSADSEDALRDYAQRFADFLDAQPQVDLAALCHTVQVGREAMKERLALVATQPAELAARLRDWLAQGQGDGMYRGRVEARRSARRVAAADEATASPLQRAQGCAQRWVAGEDPAWPRLYGAVPPPRIAAPTYPFAQERCWIVDEAGSAPAAAESATVERLHPLVSYNSSTLRDISFDSWISSALLAEFQLSLQGARVLPAAAILELACACASLAGDRRIRGVRDIVWSQPLRVQSDVQLVRTYVKDIGDSIEYVVTSLDDGSHKTVHSEGRLLLGSRHAASIDAPHSIASLKAQGVPLDAATHYQRLESRGIACGTAFRSVQELWCGGGGALARLALAQAPESRAERFVLHPALIDGAFQAALALLDGVQVRTAYVPFALEELSIVRRVARACYAHAQAVPASRGHDDVRSFDIYLLNEQGDVLVTFKGLALKALQHVDSINPLAQAG